MGLHSRSPPLGHPQGETQSQASCLGHWLTRVFDFDVATDDAPALFARWRDEIERELRSSGTKFSRNRAQLPNLELIYWPLDNLTGTLHLFLTPLPNGRARVTGLVYEYRKDGYISVDGSAASREYTADIAPSRKRSGKDIELAGGLVNTPGDMATSSMLQDGMRMGMLKLCPTELKTASPPSSHHNQVKD